MSVRLLYFNMHVIQYKPIPMHWLKLHQISHQNIFSDHVVGQQVKTWNILRWTYISICTSNRMALSAINDKFDEWQIGGVIVFRVLWTSYFGSLSYHDSNLSLIARQYETMRLLVNHQLIPIVIQTKSIFLEQICCKISQGSAVTSLHCPLFWCQKIKT